VLGSNTGTADAIVAGNGAVFFGNTADKAMLTAGGTASFRNAVAKEINFQTFLFHSF
jgi:hypothetical protein